MKHYKPEERARAVALTVELGSASAAGRRLGIPGATIRRWMAGKRAPETREMVQEVKGRMVDRLTASMWLSHEKLADALQNDKLSPSQVITAFGVLSDKVLAWQRFEVQPAGTSELDRIAEALEAFSSDEKPSLN